MARAERRETALASALNAHAKTVTTLHAEVKETDRLLSQSRDELTRSVNTRSKAAERLLAVEQRGTAKAKDEKTNK